MMRKFFQIQNNIVFEYYSKQTFIREDFISQFTRDRLAGL